VGVRGSVWGPRVRGGHRLVGRTVLCREPGLFSVVSPASDRVGGGHHASVREGAGGVGNSRRGVGVSWQGRTSARGGVVAVDRAAEVAGVQARRAGRHGLMLV